MRVVIRSTLDALRDRCAVSALEYTILVGTLAVALTASLFIFGTTIADVLAAIGPRVAAVVANVGN